MFLSPLSPLSALNFQYCQHTCVIMSINIDGTSPRTAKVYMNNICPTYISTLDPIAQMCVSIPVN